MKGRKTVMKKILFPGTIPGKGYGRGYPVPVFTTVHLYTGDREKEQTDITLPKVTDPLLLSITGVVGPLRDGDCIGNSGQCIDSLDEITNFAEGWDKEKVQRLKAVWEEWHLNDMRPKCIHQKDWDTGKELVVQRYRYVAKVGYYGEKIKYGEATEEEKALFEEAEYTWKITSVSGTSEAYPEESIKKLLGLGLLEETKTELELAGWTYASEHPEGLLSKPCPVCGYKYGNAWLYEALPQDVIEFLEGLPESEREPAWTCS